MITLSKAALAIFLCASVAGLSACSETAEAPASESAAVGLTVSNARIVLAPVAGNPAAVYFDLSYSGDAPAILTSVAVEGAGMTMIHDYAESAGTMQMTMADAVPLASGTPVTFAPGGLHVMAMEPTDALQAGATATVTLTLSNGATATVTAPVRAAGEER